MNDQSRLETLKEMVAQEPDDDFSRYGLALEYKKLGQYEEAHSQFDELIKRHPNYVPAYFMSGQLLVDEDRTDEAVERLEQGITAANRTNDQHAKAEMLDLLESLQ